MGRHLLPDIGEKILDVGNSDNVVNIFLVDRNAGIPFLLCYAIQFLYRTPCLDCRDVGPMRHKIRDEDVVKGEDVLYVFTLAVLNGAALLATVDHGEDFSLRDVVLLLHVVNAGHAGDEQADGIGDHDGRAIDPVEDEGRCRKALQHAHRTLAPDLPRHNSRHGHHDKRLRQTDDEDAANQCAYGVSQLKPERHHGNGRKEQRQEYASERHREKDIVLVPDESLDRFLLALQKFLGPGLRQRHKGGAAQVDKVLQDDDDNETHDTGGKIHRARVGHR